MNTVGNKVEEVTQYLDVNKQLEELKNGFEKQLVLHKSEKNSFTLTSVFTKNIYYSQALEALFNQTITGVALLDNNYNYIWVNKIYAQELSRHTEELVGKNHFDIYYCDKTKVIFDNVLRTKQTAAVYSKPFKFTYNNEISITYWDWTLTPILGLSGKVELLSLVSKNVTENINNQEKLHDSEELYRSIFATSLDGILLARSDGTILSANPAACQMLGRSEAEICEIGRKGIVYFDDQLRNAIAERQSTGSYSSELTMIRKDGTKFYVDVTSKVFKDKSGNDLISIIFRNISERKEYEANLLLSEKKFSQAFYNNQAMMAIVRISDSKFVDINFSALAAFGYEYRDIIGKSFFELNLWVDIRERVGMLRELSNKGFVKDFECRFRNKTGQIVVMLCTANHLNIDGNNYYLVSALDMIRHKEAEEALYLSEELFHKTFNINPIAMAILSLKCNKILEFNEGFGKLTGNNYTREEFLQQKENNDIWVELNEKERFLSEIEREEIVRNHEVKLRKRSGDIAIVLISGVFIKWRNEKCVLLAANDITELRKYQDQIAQLDRLKLIGITSKGIAHEIRNPMTTVRGFLQLFKERDRYATDKEHLELMIAELDKVEYIITEFLSLAKKKAGNLKQQSLNSSIRKMLPVLQAEADKINIYIKSDLNEIPVLIFDEEEIRQLILNLVHNGLDAMSSGGYLTIKTFTMTNEVVMAVEDQGIGISPEVMDKIGMPFFTTKDYGTGLGLAICYNIAYRNNARIEVETSHKGTVFKVYFSLSPKNYLFLK